jgi:hypothetical protein
MNCVVLQPSYIPWRGFFHQVRKSDVFVHYDDVQFDKHGWRNRNQVKGRNGLQWLTIPVRSKGNVSQGLPINEVMIDHSTNWARKHWETIRQIYGKAPYFSNCAPWLQDFYAEPPARLVDFVIPLTEYLAAALGIHNVRFVRSSELATAGKKTDRLVDLLTQVGATHYISGPSAKSYMEEDKLAAAGIGLEYIVYDYPEYAQPNPPFVGNVSVLDLLFAHGPDAGQYIWAKEQLDARPRQAA